MRFLPGNENQGSKVPKFMWTNFPQFGSLKTRVSGFGKNRIYGPILKKTYTLKQKYQQTLVSWIGRNRFFILPISAPYALTKVCAL